MSNPVIEKLLREHDGMRSVLLAVRRQLDKLELNESPDFALLHDALYYMRKFPGVFHHPVEELIFARLLQRNPVLAADIERVQQEHKEIYELEAWLLETAVQASREGAAAYPRLLDFGRRYLLIQRQHSETEEDLIFPHALSALQPEDWQAIQRQVQHVEDPIFSGRVLQGFKSLYRDILRAGTA